MKETIAIVIFFCLLFWATFMGMQDNEEKRVLYDQWSVSCVEQGGYVLERYRTKSLCVPKGTVIEVLEESN